MKKLTLLLIFSMTAQFLFSQVGFHAGVNVGVNSVWILNQNNYGYSELDYNLKFGTNPGLAVGYNFTENAGVQLELNYTTMGQNYYDKIRDFGPVGDDGKPKKVDTYRYVKLNYLQIPVLFRYQTTRASKSKIDFHAMIGPSFGLLLNADQYYQADIDGNGSVEDLDFDFVPGTANAAFSELATPQDYFSSLDIGIQIDLGVDVYFTDNVYLTAAIQAYDGFTDLNSETTRITPDYTASHNGYAGINIGIHYMMAEKKKK